MAKKEFGLSVSRVSEGEKATFESLFGISAKEIDQYELPYNIVTEQVGYYGVEPSTNNQFAAEIRANWFESSRTIALAA